MLRRRGSWRAALGLGRPRCAHSSNSRANSDRVTRLASTRRVSPANQITTTTSTNNATALSSFSSSPFITSSAATTRAPLAAFSEHVVEMREHVLNSSLIGQWPEGDDDDALQRRPAGSLVEVLATNDAYLIFGAMLQQEQQQQQHKSAVLFPSGLSSEVEELMRNAETEAPTVATLLCACVAVTLHPTHWPPWVSARFTSSGTASAPVAWKTVDKPSTSARSLAAADKTNVTTSAAAASLDAAPLSPLHALAAQTLRRLARQLPRAPPPTPAASLSSSASTGVSSSATNITASTAAGATSSLQLLRWLAQLCGVCLSPSRQSALQLARLAGAASLDAAGVALKAYCDATSSVATTAACAVPGRALAASSKLVATATGEDAASAADAPAPSPTSAEERWLALWGELTRPSAAPPSLPPVNLSVALSSSSAACWSAGLAPAVLREARVSWHLHCLLQVKEAHHAARLLAGTFHDVTASQDSDKTSAEQDNQLANHAPHAIRPHAALPLSHAVQTELLSSLPLPLLEQSRLGERLTFSLLTQLHHTARDVSREAPSPLPLPRSFVPAVSTHAIVYARMLRYLLASSAQVQWQSGYVQHLHDLALLLSSANVHALAASFVPVDQPLSTVMSATHDTHREAHAQEVVGAVRAVVEALCEEPTPLLATADASFGAADARRGGDEARKADTMLTKASTATAAPANGTAKPKRRTRQTSKTAAESSLKYSYYQQQQDKHLLATDARGAFSWRWREAVMEDVDGAVQAAVRLLTSLLELCANRKTSLPLRKSEPRWRRELRERTAVRAHKFELLVQELPHDELQAVLRTLLGHGYHREGSRLGVSLLKGDQVDLRYYPLPLLGSLYLAVSTTMTAAASPFMSASPTRAQHGSGDGEEKQEEPRESRAVVLESDRWKQAVYKMYRRRFEIYGDADLNVTAPSYTTLQIRGTEVLTPVLAGGGNSGGPASCSTTVNTTTTGATTSTTTALVCTPQDKLVEALVRASTAPTAAAVENGTAELANCLLNRRVVVGGRGVVVDVGAPQSSPFGSWVRKGTTATL